MSSSVFSPVCMRTFCRATSTGLMVNNSNSLAAAGLAARKSLLAITAISAASQPSRHGSVVHRLPMDVGPSIWVGETDGSVWIETHTELSPGRRSLT